MKVSLSGDVNITEKFKNDIVAEEGSLTGRAKGKGSRRGCGISKDKDPMMRK